MTLPEQIALTVLAVVCGAAGWMMGRSGAGLTTRIATWAVAAALLVQLLLQAAGSDNSLPLDVAGLLLAPLAVVAYPRVDAAGAGPVGPLACAAVAVLAGTAFIAPESGPLVVLAIALTLVGRTWWALERGDRLQRTALLWVMITSAFATLVGMLVGFGYEALAGSDSSLTLVFSLLVCALIPAAMVVGVLRPDLVDVRWLVSTVVLVLTVLVCFIAAASLVVFGVEWLSGGRLTTSAVVSVCAVLALGVAPAQRALRGTIERLLFGGRPDPLVALASVAAQLGEDLDGALTMVRSALVVPYLRLEVDGQVLGVTGQETPHVTVVELAAAGTGRLVVGQRPGERTWSQADNGVIVLVAALLARIVRTQALADEVVASRRETVTAIEEERRRLRRDLHDGLGPTLTGVAFSADAARNLIARDPEAAAELLTRLRSDTSGAIAEVRRLVEGLRPPALDELGLVGALRTWADGLHAAGGARLDVRFEGAERVDELSAAGEAAAYRVVVEALTNVARHAGSEKAEVCFDHAPTGFVVEVRDFGAGGAWVPGAGLTSMRERAEAVGGRLVAGGGTVRLTLPVAASGG